MIVPGYAAVLALIFVVLSFRTLLLRRRKGIAIGTSDDLELTRAMRVHSNFAEYAPIALLLIYFLEVRVGSGLLIHLLCVALLLGRVLHAFGVSQTEEKFFFRVSGMFLTLACIISASTRLLISYA